MAVLETKILQVDNDQEKINQLGNVMACFGWTITNIQITHSQDTRTYSSAWDLIGGNQTKTVETTTLNYATITFQRNRGETNYQRLVELEKEYFALHTELEQAKEDMLTVPALKIFRPTKLAQKVSSLLTGRPTMDERLERYDRLMETHPDRLQAILNEATALVD